MRKIFALILSLFMAVCLFFAAETYAAEDVAIKISDAEAESGQTIELSLSISDNPGLCALRLFIGYDSNVLTLEKAEFTGLFGGGGAEVNTALNPFIMVWNLGTSDFKEDGELAVLRFKVKEGAAAGKTAVTLTSEAGDAFNVNFVDVPLALENGSVTVKGAAQSTAAQSSTAAADNKGSDDSNSTVIVVFAGLVVAVLAVAALVGMIRKKGSR